MTRSETTTIDLQRHFIRAGGGQIWRGNTGRITIEQREIELADLRSTSGEGHLDVAGTYARTGRRANEEHNRERPRAERQRRQEAVCGRMIRKEQQAEEEDQQQRRARHA